MNFAVALMQGADPYELDLMKYKAAYAYLDRLMELAMGKTGQPAGKRVSLNWAISPFLRSAPQKNRSVQADPFS